MNEGRLLYCTCEYYYFTLVYLCLVIVLSVCLYRQSALYLVLTDRNLQLISHKLVFWCRIFFIWMIRCTSMFFFGFYFYFVHRNSDFFLSCRTILNSFVYVFFFAPSDIAKRVCMRQNQFFSYGPHI